jgi:hypothetical protein
MNSMKPISNARRSSEIMNAGAMTTRSGVSVRALRRGSPGLRHIDEERRDRLAGCATSMNAFTGSTIRGKPS